MSLLISQAVHCLTPHHKQQGNETQHRKDGVKNNLGWILGCKHYIRLLVETILNGTQYLRKWSVFGTVHWKTWSMWKTWRPDLTNPHFEEESYSWLFSRVSSQRNFTSSINLSSHPTPFFCTPPSLPLTSSLPNSPPSAQLFIFSYYNSGNRVLSAWQSIHSEAGFTPMAALPLLLTRFPKGRKAHLWPSAWWAPTAVCSGITPGEKGGIPAPAAFVTARPLFAFDKTAVQSPPGPHGWREGKEPRGDFRLMVVSLPPPPEVASPVYSSPV